MTSEVIFLKWGGSLITEKDIPHKHRPEVLRRLSEELAQSLHRHPGRQLLLGHGSGSFGHVPGKKYGTRAGVHTPEEWRGFTAVWKEAFELNHLVIEYLHAAGIPAQSFPASAGATASYGSIIQWNTDPLRKALERGLLPVVYGDVAFDVYRGGTIVSTEDIFTYLVTQLSPHRILLAGLEPGVWADFPTCTRLLEQITPASYQAGLLQVGGSASIDVTGGMESKVKAALDFVRDQPDTEVVIFSAEEPGALKRALAGEKIGTRFVAR